MADEVFADGIERITVQGGVVRIDYASLAPDPADPEGNGRVIHRQRVILPLGGFVKSFQTMQRTVQQLAQQGVLRLDSED